VAAMWPINNGETAIAGSSWRGVKKAESWRKHIKAEKCEKLKKLSKRRKKLDIKEKAAKTKEAARQ